jgi:branched-chain amino acid transport system substrate-binding protein
MKNRKSLAILVALVLVLSLTMSACGGSDTIKIGMIMPITGQVATYGVQSVNAAQMFAEELNAAGGINGKKIELVIEADEATPAKTTNAFKKLVSSDKVVALVGALTSKCSLAITNEAQQKKLVMISPSSTNDSVTDAGEFVFRACYNDSFQGQVVAQFAFETLQGKTAAILFDNANDYSKGLPTNVKEKFLSLGGTIVSEESYATGDADFNAQLTKIAATNPDVLFLPDYYSTVSVISKQERALGITVPMLGADGWDEITNNAGDEVIDCYYSNHYAPDADDPEVKKFVSSYQAKYNGETPNALAALAYDSMNILTDAIAKAGTDPDKLQAAMMETNKKFVTGNVKFNDKRNPVKSAVMLKVVKGADGKLTTEYAGTVNP